MHRFTKIVATLGPASSDLATLTRLVEAGVPQAEKYKAGVAEKVVLRFRDLTGPDRPDSPAIVIWPEGAGAGEPYGVMTGDTLFIGGSARTDFMGGSAAALFDSGAFFRTLFCSMGAKRFNCYKPR